MSFQRPSTKTLELNPPDEMPEDEGRRIRWERLPEDSSRIVVLDALTGAVIAVVRSLFDIKRPRA